MDRRTIVLNLLGGPGCGKSVLMAQVFAELKILGIEAEMANEWAKEKVWEESVKVLDDQIYVFAKQLHKLNRLVGKVDVVLCDSPLLFSIVYDQSANPSFASLVLDQHRRFESANYLITRSTTYVAAGRLQNEEEARKIDARIKEVLVSNSIDYQEVGKDEAKFIIVGDILRMLREGESPKEDEPEATPIPTTSSRHALNLARFKSVTEELQLPDEDLGAEKLFTLACEVERVIEDFRGDSEVTWRDMDGELGTMLQRGINREGISEDQRKEVMKVWRDVKKSKEGKH